MLLATSFYKLAGDPGFEPGLPDPESGVLPLDESPTFYPLAKGSPIGQQIQSLLSNPLLLKFRNASLLESVIVSTSSALRPKEELPADGASCPPTRGHTDTAVEVYP